MIDFFVLHVEFTVFMLRRRSYQQVNRAYFFLCTDVAFGIENLTSENKQHGRVW